MFGYCQQCDDYCIFERDGDVLRCTECRLDTRLYDENGLDLIEVVKVPVEFGILNLQPPVLRTTTAENSVDAIFAKMPKDAAGYGELFKDPINSVIKWASEWKISMPAFAVFETPDGSLRIATAILINQDGSVEFYKPKTAPVIPIASPVPPNYQEYLKSPEWQTKRQEALTRAGNRCQICNSSERLEAHHRTYKNLGRELEGDITILCRACHQLFYDFGRLAQN